MTQTKCTTLVDKQEIDWVSNGNYFGLVLDMKKNSKGKQITDKRKLTRFEVDFHGETCLYLLGITTNGFCDA